MTTYVYIHFSTTHNNTVYIGEGTAQRVVSGHLRSPEWHKTMQGFTCSSIEVDTKSQALELEKFLIGAFKAAGATVINGNDGGRGGLDSGSYPKYPKHAGFTVRVNNDGDSYQITTNYKGPQKNFYSDTLGNPNEADANVFAENVRAHLLMSYTLDWSFDKMVSEWHRVSKREAV